MQEKSIKLRKSFKNTLFWAGHSISEEGNVDDDGNDGYDDDGSGDDDDGEDDNDDDCSGDDDAGDCRTGQSGWEDGNTKCKSEGDAQLATIK